MKTFLIFEGTQSMPLKNCPKMNGMETLSDYSIIVTRTNWMFYCLSIFFERQLPNSLT